MSNKPHRNAGNDYALHGEEPKTEFVKFRCTPAQKKVLEERAKRYPSVAAYCLEKLNL